MSNANITIGATYEDPEGIWEVTEINGEEITVKNIQEGNTDYGHECIVSAEEAAYYLNGGM